MNPLSALARWVTPWRKHTDLNTATPLRAPFRQSSLFGWIVESFGGSWQANLVLESTESLTANSAVYACADLISSDIAKLRPCLLQLQPSSVWTETTNSAYSPVLRKPNRYQTWLQFIQEWMICKLFYGNTYVLKERDNSRKVRALYILNPRRVQPLVARDGGVYYRLAPEDIAGVGPEGMVADVDDIIHDRGPCLFHPLVGVPPIYACALSGTLGNKIQRNSVRFFDNMSRPSGHLTAPGKIDDDVAARLKKTFEEGFSGNNIGRLFVSGSNLKFEPITLPPEQAQLAEQLKWSVEDVARAFKVPLYKIAAAQAPANTNVAALNLEYYEHTLQIHIESVEALLDVGLGLPADYCVEMDLEGLLRMDPKTMAEADEISVRSGVMAPNEARRRRSLPPVQGGDTPYLQQQNYSLGALAKRDAQDDPFGTAKPAAPDAGDDDTPDDTTRAALLDQFRGNPAWDKHACKNLLH